MNPANVTLSSNAIPVDPSNSITIEFWSAGQHDVEVNLQIVQVDTAGNLVRTPDNFIVRTADFPLTKRYTLTDGLLIGVSVWPTNAAVLSGQCYARITIQTGSVTGEINQWPLTGGYITGGSILNYPLTPATASTTTPAQPQQLNGIVPIPGDEAAYSAGPNLTGQLIAGTFTLTTSAAPGNRDVLLRIGAVGGPQIEVPARSTQADSLVTVYWLWIGESIPADTTTRKYIQVPSNLGGSGLTIETVTTNIDAADQYSDITFYANINTLPS